METVCAIGLNSNTFTQFEQLLQKYYLSFRCALVNVEEVVPEKIGNENPVAVVLESQNNGREILNICRALKNNEFTANIPVIIITDLKESSDTNEMLFEAGADFFLTKPISRWEFSALIRSVLAKKNVREVSTKVSQENNLFADEVDTEQYGKIGINELYDLVDNLNGFVYICRNDESWTMHYMGEKITELSGYPASDFISNRERSYSSIIHPEDRQIIFDQIQSAIKNDTFFTVEYRIVTSDGTVKWFWEKGKGFYDKTGSLWIKGFIEDISQLKLAQQERNESDERFKNIVEGAPDPIFIQTKNKFVFLNPAACQLFGIKESNELVGKPVSESIHPDYHTINSERFQQLYQKNDTANEVIELKIIGANGKETWVETTGEPITFEGFAAALIFVRDITERIAIENRLKLLSRSVEQSPAGIVITNRNGVIEYVNSTFTKITGYTPEEVLGQNPRILKSGKHDNLFYEKMWATIIAGNTWRGEVINKNKKGQFYWSEISISPVLNKNNEITHFVSVRENVTEKKKMIEELIAAKERAEESDKLKSSFLANMSHEIRTPMNGILGFAGLLKDKKLSSEEIKMYVELIQQSGQRMLNTINDLIVVSKIESGTLVLKKSEFNVNKLFDFFRDFFKPETDKKGIELKINKLLNDDDATIIADKEKLEAVLLNLIKNAVKYTDSGSIEIGYKLSDGAFQFYVKDTGIGIDEEKHTAIFERFVQVDTSLTKPYEGVGLGLSIAKGFVNLMGGKIWLESRKGSGTLFHFSIPKSEPGRKESVKDDNVGKVVNAEKPVGNDDALLKKLSVLVAEDDEIGRRYLKQLLSGKCGELDFAVNGKEAVEKYRNKKYDVVLMDIKMPVMDGYTATIKIKEFDNNAFIIAQTAYALEGDKQKALAAGCDGYITKPVNKNQLYDHLVKRKV